MDYRTNINEFLFYCKYQKNLSEKTVKAYKQDLLQFDRFLGVLENKIIIKETLKDYIKFLLSPKRFHSQLDYSIMIG